MAKGREIAAQESAPPPPLAVFAQAVILELPAGGGGGWGVVAVGLRIHGPTMMIFLRVFSLSLLIFVLTTVFLGDNWPPCSSIPCGKLRAFFFFGFCVQRIFKKCMG